MTRLTDRHPDLEEILLLVDEESSRQAARWVKQHVASCWKCGGLLQEAQDTLHELSRYHEKVLEPNVRPPPMPWRDLRAAMKAIDAETPLPVAQQGWRPGRIALAACLVIGVAMATIQVFRGIQERKTPAAVPAPRHELEAAASAKPSKSIPNEPRLLSPPNNSVAITRPPEEPSDLDLEVRTLAALHRIGADLGDPIEIAASSGRVRVVGIGLGPEREEEIRSALASLPNVQVELGRSTSVAPAGASVHLSVDAVRSPWEPQLTSLLGGRAAFEQFGSQVLDESDAVLTRLHAVRKLAEQFPPERLARLHEPERVALDTIAADHRIALNEHAMTIEKMLAQIREAVAAPAATARLGDPLEAAQRTDRALSMIFGGAPTNLTTGDLANELAQAAEDLKLRIGEMR